MVKKSKALLRAEIDIARESMKIWDKGTHPYISAKKRVMSLSERLKERGLTCDAIDRKIQDAVKSSNDFRAVGFENLAKTEDAVSNKLKELKSRVCLLH